MQPLRKEILPGVWLTYLQATKFKTGLLSMQFVVPLKQETAAYNAVLPAVLRRGTQHYPDMRSFEGALDTRYGARLDSTIRKKGENQCIGFVSSFIDDAYLPQGESLLEEMAQLMGEVLLEPVTRNGRFLPEYVHGERENLLDAIRGILNDKREYADLRLLKELCGNEAYAIDRLGDEKTAAKIQGQKLYHHYIALLETAHMEIFYSGTANLERVEFALRDALSLLPRGKEVAPVMAKRHIGRETPRYITEKMDVTQAKLSLGFSCDSEDMVAMSLCNALFGGTSNSRLFLHVREKLSLCYFASSQYHRTKGLITVSAGIESKNYQLAFDEILAQLAAIQRGELEDWELPVARKSLISAYRCFGDSQGRMEDFYLGQSAVGRTETPEEYIRLLEAVTPERIIEAARSIRLDTVYFLTEKEETV